MQIVAVAMPKHTGFTKATIISFKVKEAAICDKKSFDWVSVRVSITI